jgi:putative aldouronate transport system substrate-binding protein
MEGKAIVDNDPDIAYVDRRSVEWFGHLKQTMKAVDVNFPVQLITTPGKEKLSALDTASDIWTVIMGTGDPAAMWKDIVKDYEGRGLTQAITEVNAEARKLGY